jgi:hypothetical protein
MDGLNISLRYSNDSLTYIHLWNMNEIFAAKQSVNCRKAT